MKKLAFLLSIVFFTTVAFGQTKTEAPKKDQKPAPAKTEQVKPAKAADKPATAPAAAPAKVATKKDGTPDKRFKENKEPVKAVGPTKKDGTPDKRFKENKEPAKKK